MQRLGLSNNLPGNAVAVQYYCKVYTTKIYTSNNQLEIIVEKKIPFKVKTKLQSVWNKSKNNKKKQNI